MIRTLWTRKAAVVAVAILALAGSAAAVELARPKLSASVVLDDSWRCTTTAGIFTVCTKKPG
jgi:hypothetical protein